jgi:hypothetical protein
MAFFYRIPRSVSHKHEPNKRHFSFTDPSPITTAGTDHCVHRNTMAMGLNV